MPTFLHKYQPGAVLRATGEDAGVYLQSQCSADLATAQDNLATYGLWLSRKGKVDGDGFILRRSEEDFLIVSYHCPAEALQEKILTNVVADDVEMENLTDRYNGISLWGSETEAILEKIGLGCPGSSNWTSEEEVHSFKGRRSREGGVDWIGPPDEMIPLLEKLKTATKQAGGRELSEKETHLARIDACIPAIPDEIGPNDFPQEGFLEKDAVSFEKGCFLGQEVMARLRSMGSVQRGLWAVELREKGVFTPADLFLGDKIVGTLKTRYSNEDKEIGVAILRVKKVKEVGLNGIATTSNGSPSVFLLHEFIYQ